MPSLTLLWLEEGNLLIFYILLNEFTYSIIFVQRFSNVKSPSLVLTPQLFAASNKVTSTFSTKIGNVVRTHLSAYVSNNKIASLEL